MLRILVLIVATAALLALPGDALDLRHYLERHQQQHLHALKVHTIEAPDAFWKKEFKEGCKLDLDLDKICSPWVKITDPWCFA